MIRALCLTAALGLATAAHAAPMQITWLNGGKDQCRITKVVDGDTIDAQCGRADPRPFRLYGADTPERGQPGYTEATEAFRDLLSLGRVVARVDHYDGWNRPVVQLQSRAGDLSCILIAEGHARQTSHGGDLYDDCAPRPMRRPE